MLYTCTQNKNTKGCSLALVEACNRDRQLTFRDNCQRSGKPAEARIRRGLRAPASSCAVAETCKLAIEELLRLRSRGPPRASLRGDSRRSLLIRRGLKPQDMWSPATLSSPGSNKYWPVAPMQQKINFRRPHAGSGATAATRPAETSLRFAQKRCSLVLRPSATSPMNAVGLTAAGR